MAQTRRKRRRKHRGTPAGTIERPGRTGRPRTREEAKQLSRRRRQERMDRPPNWRSAVNRAAIAALIFGVLLVTLLGREIRQAAVLTVLIFLLYIPLGYMTDRVIYNVRKRRKAARK